MTLWCKMGGGGGGNGKLGTIQSHIPRRSALVSILLHLISTQNDCNGAKPVCAQNSRQEAIFKARLPHSSLQVAAH